MKLFLVSAILLLGSIVAFGQNELAPIVEREFDYKNWEFKRIGADGEIELRKAVEGKKLVLVVYFAPWCHNWRYEAPIVQKLYEKYKDQGFEVIGVGEYDSVDAIRNDVKFKKLTFPVVYESDSLSARLTTTHYGYRTKLGDTRKWGSPFNLFLTSANLLKEGDVIAKKLFVSAGELIEADAEKFIREKLGLPKEESKALRTESAGSDVCDPNALVLKKPC